MNVPLVVLLMCYMLTSRIFASVVKTDNLQCILEDLNIEVVVEKGDAMIDEPNSWANLIKGSKLLYEYFFEGVETSRINMGYLAFNDRIHPNWKMTNNRFEMELNILEMEEGCAPEFCLPERGKEYHLPSALQHAISQFNSTITKTSSSRNIIIYIGTGQVSAGEARFKEMCNYSPKCQFGGYCTFNHLTGSNIAYESLCSKRILDEAKKDKNIEIFTIAPGKKFIPPDQENFLDTIASSPEKFLKISSYENFSANSYIDELVGLITCDDPYKIPVVQNGKCTCSCRQNKNFTDVSHPCYRIQRKHISDPNSPRKIPNIRKVPIVTNFNRIIDSTKNSTMEISIKVKSKFVETDESKIEHKGIKIKESYVYYGLIGLFIVVGLVQVYMKKRKRKLNEKKWSPTTPLGSPS